MTGAARHAEPAATLKVTAVAKMSGGTVERLVTRLRGLDSVEEKLDRFRAVASPRYRLERFNDALRYTITFSEPTYWRAVEDALEALVSDGFSVRRMDSRWNARGYKGINATVRNPQDFDFEVQLHTTRSLAAAELTHGMHKEQRGQRRGSGPWRKLETQQREVWKSVPVPPRRRELS